MKWKDIKERIAKDSSRKKERLALLDDLHSSWDSADEDGIKELLVERIQKMHERADELSEIVIGTSMAEEEEEDED